MNTRLAAAAALLVSCLVGCGDGGVSLPVTPSNPTTVYSATLSASSSCAGKLPAGEAVRVYEVTMSYGGDLLWQAPTITQSRADQRSTLKMDGGAVSLVIGNGWPDPQDTLFYGIWEDLGGGRVLAVYGQGSGQAQGSAMSGTFEGDFDAEGANGAWSSCHAADHHFTLTPQ